MTGLRYLHLRYELLLVAILDLLRTESLIEIHHKALLISKLNVEPGWAIMVAHCDVSCRGLRNHDPEVGQFLEDRGRGVPG